MGRGQVGGSSWGCHSWPVETKGDSWQEGTVGTSTGEGRTCSREGGARQYYKVQAGQSPTGEGLPSTPEVPFILLGQPCPSRPTPFLPGAES